MLFKGGEDALGIFGKMFGNKSSSPEQEKSPEMQYNSEIATEINNEFKRRQQERKPWELQERLNIEFLNGNQYLDIDASSMTIRDIPKMYDHQEREVFNQIATIYETRNARLIRQKPIMKVRPASKDDADISAAKVSSSLMVSSWHDQGMDDAYGLMIPWMELSGTVFLKPIWNTKKGRVIGKRLVPDYSSKETKPLENEIRTEEQDQQLGKDMMLEIIREGDCDTCVVPANEIYPDSPWRNGVNQCRSIIHARAYHIDEIEEMWEVRVESENVDIITLQQTPGGSGGLGYTSSGFRGGVSSVKDHAILKEYYERPCRRYPEGRFIVVAGDTTLHVGPMPYMIGDHEMPEIPLIRFCSIDRPGCFWGKSIIERCIPVQRRYNALRNRVAEYLNMVAIGQWYDPEGCLDDDSELNNAPNNIIHYRPINGMKPEPVQFPNLPPQFQTELQTLLAEFTSISGVSELSRFSEAPSGVKSGVALGIANDQDDTRLATTAGHIANGVILLGKYWLRLYRQFVQESRILRSVGISHDVEVAEWYVSQLRSDDVIIENSSALAESPSQRRQMVFDLLGTGIFNRPETNPFTEEGKQKIFQLLEFGHWETAGEDMEVLQKQRAKRENAQIIGGELQEVPMIQDFDDDNIHIDQHNRMRMSAEWEAALLTPIGPMLNMIMLKHQEQHLVRFKQAQMQQQMQMLLSEAKVTKPAEKPAEAKAQ